MKQWQVNALRAIDATAQKMKNQVLAADYIKDVFQVHGEIDVWVTAAAGEGWQCEHKLFEPFWTPVIKS